MNLSEVLPTTEIDAVSEFTCRSAIQATASEGPYVAAKAGFKPTTLRLQGIDSTNAPPRPSIVDVAHC